MSKYHAGQYVRVRLFGDITITATILHYEEDIKNGYPGYDLTDCSDGIDHWCYEDQIVGPA